MLIRVYGAKTPQMRCRPHKTVRAQPARLTGHRKITMTSRLSGPLRGTAGQGRAQTFAQRPARFTRFDFTQGYRYVRKRQNRGGVLSRPAELHINCHGKKFCHEPAPGLCQGISSSPRSNGELRYFLIRGGGVPSGAAEGIASVREKRTTFSIVYRARRGYRNESTLG